MPLMRPLVIKHDRLAPSKNTKNVRLGRGMEMRNPVFNEYYFDFVHQSRFDPSLLEEYQRAFVIGQHYLRVRMYICMEKRHTDLQNYICATSDGLERLLGINDLYCLFECRPRVYAPEQTILVLTLCANTYAQQKKKAKNYAKIKQSKNQKEGKVDSKNTGRNTA